MNVKNDVYNLANKICPGELDQCHYCVDTLVNSKHNIWSNLLEPVYWDGGNHRRIAYKIRDTFQKTGITAIDHLVEDIVDLIVHGHSFIKFGNTFIDPTLKAMGVSDEAIDKFDRYLYSIYSSI